MKLATPRGTILLSQSPSDAAWYFRAYPFKVEWYLEFKKGKQESKRFALASELTQFLLDKWGPVVSDTFSEAPLATLNR